MLRIKHRCAVCKACTFRALLSLWPRSRGFWETVDTSLQAQVLTGREMKATCGVGGLLKTELGATMLDAWGSGAPRRRASDSQRWGSTEGESPERGWGGPLGAVGGGEGPAERLCQQAKRENAPSRSALPAARFSWRGHGEAGTARTGAREPGRARGGGEQLWES